MRSREVTLHDTGCANKTRPLQIKASVSFLVQAAHLPSGCLDPVRTAIQQLLRKPDAGCPILFTLRTRYVWVGGTFLLHYTFTDKEVKLLEVV